MAEVVHRNLELMLPELEELERSGIFSPHEIKAVVRRRRSMEYKLQRKPVRKEDYLRAITYELNLDKLRRVRKKRLGVTSARRDAEYGIQDRVHSLFKRAVKRFKGDVRLWLQYIDFCQKSHHHLSLGKVLAKALALHPNKPGLWVTAAKFQFEVKNDPSSGRSTMQRGLRSNPSSTQLWLEYFRMELMHVEKMKKRRLMLGLEKSTDEEFEKLGSEFFSYEIPSIVFREAVRAVPGDLEFLVEFLEIYRLFDGTEQRQEEVYACVKRDHSHRALCWEILARRHTKNNSLSNSAANQTGGDPLYESDRILRSEECYREGFGVTTETQLLWKHYIRWCHERVRDDCGSDTTQLHAIRRLLAAYKTCTESKHMTEDMIKEQVEVLRGMGLSEEAHKALVVGTDSYPHSHTLWMLRLESERCASGEIGDCGEEEEGVCKKLLQLCSKAVDTIPAESSLCIWQFWLDLLISTDSPASDVEAIFQRAIVSTPHSDQEKLSLQYIDWSLSVGGVKSARKTYERLLDGSSVQSYPLYLKCIEVEKSQEKPSVKRLRGLYDRALAEWGSDHPELWLDYIASETLLPGADPARVARLHWKATRTLTDTHIADFISKYSLLHLN